MHDVFCCFGIAQEHEDVGGVDGKKIGSNVRTKIHWIYLINLINYMSQPYVLESTLRISVG